MITEADLKKMLEAAERSFEAAKLAAANNAAGIQIASARVSALEREIEASTTKYVGEWLESALHGGTQPDSDITKLREQFSLVTLILERLNLKVPFVTAAELETASRLHFIESKCITKTAEREEQLANEALQTVGSILGERASLVIENSRAQILKRQAGMLAEESLLLSQRAAQILESAKGN